MTELDTEVKQEEVKEVKPTFNPDDFTTSTAKPKDEAPKVETTAKVEPNPTDNPAETKAEETKDDEFEVSFDDIDLGKNPESVSKPKKDIFTSLKEIDPELEDEEKVVENYKNLKDRNKKLEVIAKGRSLIDTDTDIIEWNKMSKMSDEDKAKSKLYYEYRQKGFDHNKASERVEKAIEDLKDVNPTAIEDYAIEFSALLKKSIETKTKTIEDSILANNVDLEVGDDVLKNTETAILETKDFLGMNLPKDDAKREKVLKDAGKFANSTEFKNLLKDPKTLGKIAQSNHCKLYYKNYQTPIQ